MILWIIGLVLLCIIPFIICKFWNNYYASDIAGIVFAIGLIYAIIISGVTIIYHVGTSSSIYALQQERASIINTIDSTADVKDLTIIDKQTLMTSIADWNSNCYSYKYWAASPWTSWILNQKLVEYCQEITFEEVGLE